MDKNDNNEAAIKSEIERLQRELKEKERKFELRKLRKKAKLEKLSNNSVIKAPIEAPPIKINNNEPGALNDCYNPIKKSKVTFQEEVTVFQDPGSQNDNKEVGHHQKGSEEVFQTLDSVETVPANQSNVRKSKRSRKAVDYVELSKGSGPKRSKIDHKEIAILAFEAVIQIAKETPDEEFHLPLDIFPNYSYSLSSVISRIANDDRNAELLLYNQSSSSSDNTLESWKDTDERESKSSVSPCHDETEVERCNAEETENVNVICTTQKLVSSEVMEAEMKENLKISSVDTFQIDLRQMVEEPVEEVDDIFSFELDEGLSNIELGAVTKSVMEPSKPIADTSKPVAETSKPIAETTSKPIAQTTKPITETSKPIAEPSKPITEPPKPITETTKPITETTKPIVETSKPIVETTKPIPETTKPIPETSKPITETPKPITKTPKPITKTPKPITETPKPITETLKPIAETTEPITETSKPIVETTKPIPETTKPITETPKPITETSKPITETTKPITETTKPVERIEDVQTELLLEKPYNEVVTKTDIVNLDESVIVNETEDIFAEVLNKTQEHVQLLETEPEMTQESQTQPLTTQNSSCSEVSQVTVKEYVGEDTVPEIDAQDIFVYDLDEQDEQEVSSNIIPKIGVKSEHIMSQSKDPTTNEHILFQTKDPTTSERILSQSKDYSTSEHISSQSKEFSTSEHILSQSKEFSTSEHISSQSKEYSTSERILSQSKEDSTSEHILSQSKEFSTSEHILSQSKEDSTSEHISSQSKEYSTSERILSQSKEYSTSEHILPQCKDYSTSERILSQSKEYSTSEHILSQSKEYSTSEYIMSQTKDPTTSEHILSQTKDHTTSEHILSQPEQNSSQPNEHSTSDQNSSQPEEHATSEQNSSQPKEHATSEQNSSQPKEHATSEHNSSQPKEHSTLSIKFEEENVVGAETDENHKETIQVPKNVNENQNDIEKYVHKFNDNNETKSSVTDHEMVLKDIKNTREINNIIHGKDLKKEDNEIDDKEMIEKKVKTSTIDSNVVFCVKRHSFNCYKCPKDEPILKILCLDREKSLFAVQQLTTIQIMKLNDTRQWEMIYYNYLNQEIIFSCKLADYLVILMKENLFGVNYNNLEEFYHGFNIKKYLNNFIRDRFNFRSRNGERSGDFKACSLQNNFFATCSIIDDQSQVTVHKIKHNKLLSSKVMEQTAETLTNICSVSNIDKVVAGVTTNGIILWNYHLGIIKLRVTLDPVIDAPFSLSWITREENKNLLYSLIKLDNHPNSCLLVINPLTGKHQILREYKSALNILDNKSRSYFVDNPCVTEVISEERLVVYNLFTGTEKASLEIDSVTSGVTVCLGDKNFILTGFKNGCLHSFFM